MNHSVWLSGDVGISLSGSRVKNRWKSTVDKKTQKQTPLKSEQNRKELNAKEILQKDEMKLTIECNCLVEGDKNNMGQEKKDG